MYMLDTIFGVNYYQRYFVDDQELMGATNLLDILYTVGLAVMFFVFYIFKNKLNLNDEQRKKYDLFLLMFLMVPLIRILGMALYYQALVNRLTLYFFFSLLILIPLFVEGTRGTKYHKFIVPAVYIVAGGYMYYLLAIKMASGVALYKFIWK